MTKYDHFVPYIINQII